MEVVDTVDLWNGKNVASNMVCSDISGCTLHEDVEALHESGDRRDHHQDREEEGAKRVDDQPVRLEHNDKCGDDDTDRLQQVANQVNDGCLHVDVDRLVVIVVVAMRVVLVHRVVVATLVAVMMRM